MKDDCIIIRVDGGIASQIQFLCLGLAFERKGYKVKYDLTWFETMGKGFYNQEKGYNDTYDITWDIPKAFTRIQYEVATKEEIRRYKRKYFIDDENVIERKPPLYIGGYLGRCQLGECREYLIEHFNPVDLDQKTQELAAQIRNTFSCAIHVRRGDLSNFNSVYGEPTSIAYFIKSIELIEGLTPPPVQSDSFFLVMISLGWRKI